jgi:hypothetical protein
MSRPINPKSKRQLALKNGVNLSTLRYRERKGWDKIDALIIKPVDQKKATDQQIIDCEKIGLTIRRSAYLLGINKTALRDRIARLGIDWRGKGAKLG